MLIIAVRPCLYFRKLGAGGHSTDNYCFDSTRLSLTQFCSCQTFAGDLNSPSGYCSPPRHVLTMIDSFQVIGLSLSQTLDDLALLYLATVQALAVRPMCFMRHIISFTFSYWYPLSTKNGNTCLLLTFFFFSFLVSAWYASYSGGHERGRTWHQNPLPVRRVEQKRSVCSDSKQCYRYEICLKENTTV